MASLLVTGGSQALNNASIRNQGGQAGFLGGPGAIDGTMQSFYNLGDPLNLTGKASSGHVLSNILDPGNIFGQNQAANPLNNANANGVPSILPNLGPQSMMPQMPQGAFQRFNPGVGPYNQMAAQSMGGQMFNPGINMQPGHSGKGAIGMTPQGFNLQQLITGMKGNGR